MPLPVGWVLRRARELAEAVGTPRRLGAAESRGSRLVQDPAPPRRLRARVGAPGRAEWISGGTQAARSLASGAAAAGLDLAACRRILDFGCGAGRVLPHLDALAPAARCAGCDVDPAAITWAAGHRPGCDWVLSGYAPPLPFGEGEFDLVYSISVLSHLAEEGQDAWLPELRRVLAPGGVALLSIHGRHALDEFREGRVRSGWCDPDAFARGPLRPEEFVFVPYRRSRWNRGELPGIGSGYGLAFHGALHLRERWGQTFEIVAVRERAVAGWQDLVVCRKRD